MVPVSIVIITKNEAEIIVSCLRVAQIISDDIIIVDNGSTDNTTEIADQYGCRVYHENWDGYGANKNKGITKAKYDWILSIDADEIPDLGLIADLHRIKFINPYHVYDISFKSYFGKKRIRFGSWGRDHHLRLFNRKLVKWSESPVHETLLLPEAIAIKKLKGHLHHYSVKDSADFLRKADHYAILSAAKYRAKNKKSTFLKLHIAPIFHFVKNYIIFLGFLDGPEGLAIARMISKHTRLKYRLLKEQPNLINYQENRKVKDNLVVEY